MQVAAFPCVSPRCVSEPEPHSPGRRPSRWGRAHPHGRTEPSSPPYGPGLQTQPRPEVPGVRASPCACGGDAVQDIRGSSAPIHRRIEAKGDCFHPPTTEWSPGLRRGGELSGARVGAQQPCPALGVLPGWRVVRVQETEGDHLGADHRGLTTLAVMKGSPPACHVLFPAH